MSEKVKSLIEENNGKVIDCLTSLLPVVKKHLDKSDLDFLLRRIIAYEPSSKVIEQYDADLSRSAGGIFNTILTKRENLVNNFKDSAFAAKCFLALSDYPNAYTCSVRSKELCSDNRDPVFWFCHGVVCQYYKYHRDASASFGKAEQFLDVLKSDKQFVGELYFRYAVSLRTIGEYNKADSYFQKTLQSLPDNLTEDDIIFQRAFNAQSAGKFEECIRLYDSLYAKDCNHKNIELIRQYAWAMHLFDNERSIGLALKLCDEGLMLSEDDHVLNFVKGQISLKKGETQDAYTQYKVCLNHWQSNPLFWCVLGVLYLKNDQKSDAQIAFQRAICLKSDIPEAWCNFALIFHRSNDHESADKIYKTALMNCNNSQIIQDRHEKSKNPKCVESFDIVHIDPTALYTQTAERIAYEHISCTPHIPLTTEQNGRADLVKWFDQLHCKFTTTFPR